MKKERKKRRKKRKIGEMKKANQVHSANTGTFVMPRTPSFFSSPLQRLKLYRVRLNKFIEGVRMCVSMLCFSHLYRTQDETKTLNPRLSLPV